MSLSCVFRRVLIAAGIAFCVSCPIYADVVVSAGSASALTGQIVSVPINVSGVLDLYAYEFDVSFNPAIVQLQNITEGPFLAGAGTTFFGPGTIDNTAGTAVFTFDTLIGPIGGAAGSGTLANFSFLPIALGTSPVSLANVILLDSSLNILPVTTSDGVITVTPEPSVSGICALALFLLALTVAPLQRRWKARARS